MKTTTARVLILFLLLTTLPAAAEWVSERLYLGLYPQPDPEASPMQMVPTGDEVEVLQRQGDFVQLRLDDGTEGWARAEFITDQPPAAIRIEQVTAERDEARQQLQQAQATEQTVEELQGRLAQAGRTVTRLRNQLQSAQQETTEEVEQADETVETQRQKIETLQADLTAAQERSAALQTKLDTLQARVERNQKRPDAMLLKIVWVLVSMLICLIIGLIAGMRWMAARVRKRFNGLKVW